MYLNHFKTILGVIPGNPSQCKVDELRQVMINVQSVSLGILERVGISRLYKVRKYASKINQPKNVLLKWKLKWGNVFGNSVLRIHVELFRLYFLQQCLQKSVKYGYNVRQIVEITKLMIILDVCNQTVIIQF